MYNIGLQNRIIHDQRRQSKTTKLVKASKNRKEIRRKKIKQFQKLKTQGSRKKFRLMERRTERIHFKKKS